MMETRNKKRLQLILLFSMFFVPMLIAAVLAFFTGWAPGTRSFGEGILPQRSVVDVPVELADGARLEWRDPDWRWSVVAVPSKTCGEHCLRQLDQVNRVRFSLNQKSNRVRLVYLGEPPTGADAQLVMPQWDAGRDVEQRFAEWIPSADDQLAVLLIKPDGTALTVYRAGFDPAGLRKDLAKVTK